MWSESLHCSVALNKCGTGPTDQEDGTISIQDAHNGAGETAQGAAIVILAMRAQKQFTKEAKAPEASSMILLAMRRDH